MKIKAEQQVIRQSQKLLEQNHGKAIAESQLSGAIQQNSSVSVDPSGSSGNSKGSSTIPSDKEQRDSIKDSEEFREKMDELEKIKDDLETELRTKRMDGEISYKEYIDGIFKAENDYYTDAIKYFKSKIPESLNPDDDSDLKKLVSQQEKITEDHNRETLTLSDDVLKRERDTQLREVQATLKNKSSLTIADELAVQEQVLQIKLDYFSRAKELYKDDLEKVNALEIEEQELLENDKFQKKQAMLEKAREYEQKMSELSAADRFKLEKAALDKLLEEKIITEEQYQEYLELTRKNIASSSGLVSKNDATARKEAKQKALTEAKDALEAGLISKEQYAKRIADIEKEFSDVVKDSVRGVGDEWGALTVNLYQTWSNFFTKLKDGSADWKDTLSAALSATASAMAAVTSQVSALMEAEIKIRESRIKKYYSKEIELAEGNTRRVKELERERDAQLTEMKKREQKKVFALQVATAIAQTAANAISAYGAGLQIGGLPGLILAPIAAAMATAAGLVQVATIKKQQQAGLESGYMKGGFTRKGRKDEEAGIVHAGEWVAPAEMVNNPRSGAIIRILETARKTNTYGSLLPEDVSRTITAPVRAAGNTTETVIVAGADSAQQNERISRISETLDRLDSTVDQLERRLERPFITVATVAGDHGVANELKKYKRLNKNNI